MNLKKENKMLKHENNMLKLQILKLRMDIHEMNDNWIHPNSCLHNEDPWKVFK